MSDEPRTPSATRSLRRDALVNQERVLAAAVTTILREGRNVPLARIAAEAGVGIGTLYRHYPSRAALLDALTLRSFRLLFELAQAAERRDGPALAGLDWWWDRVIELRDQLVLPLGGAPVSTSPPVRAEQSRLHESLQRLLARGQREGSIRADVSTRDLIIFGAMLVAPLPGALDWAQTARRQKEIHLDGLAGPGAASLRAGWSPT